MYTKQLLEDINQVINPAFIRAIDFKKLNEAIENNQMIDLSLLTEEAETSIKKSLMRILGRKVIPAVMLGAALLATGNASARCTSSDSNSQQSTASQQSTLKTRCFTPQAVKEITAYERDTLSKVPRADRNFFYISSAKPVLIDKKPVFVDSGKDDIYAAEVKSKAGTYYALLDTYDKEGVFLIVPDFEEKSLYLLSNKKQWNSKGDAITSWTLVTTEKFSSVGPITKKYLGYLELVVGSGLSFEDFFKQKQEPEKKLKTRGLQIK